MYIEQVGFVKSLSFWGLLTTALTHVFLRIALIVMNADQ